MSVLTVVLPVAGALIVALLGYYQWRRTERHKVHMDTANLRLVEQERARTATTLFRQQRIQVLQELVGTLKSLELESRWNAGGHDMRSEVPKLNSFLIRNRAVLDDEDCRLARDFLDGLTWIDYYAERKEMEQKEAWEERRRRHHEQSGEDIGPYDAEQWSEWHKTATNPGEEVIRQIRAEAEKWRSSSQALEARLRTALQGQ